MRTIIGFLAAAMLGSVTLAQAQTDFPTKPVVIVVPFAAGGPSDVATRILADELSKIWKQQVVIENKPGGGTIIGTSQVANARPDGHTIIMVSNSFMINAATRSNLPYDTLKDFQGLAIFVDAPLAIVAHPGFAPNTLTELMEEARKRPDRPLNYGSPGVGSPSHLTGELISRRANVKLSHVSYAGDAAGMPDALAGRVDFQIGTWANQRPYVESGKLKLITVLNDKRLPEAPNTPIINEIIKDIGMPLGATSYLVAPAKVPKEVIAKMSADIKTVVNSKFFQDKILGLGSYPRYASPEETDTFVKNGIALWSEIAKAAGIKLE